jgi:16S rRNA (guanine527-N7)-methyltransferase
MNQLKDYTEKLDIDISNAQLSKFISYEKLLIKWNQNINLISKNDEKKIENQHFIDSLGAYPYIKNHQKGIDIGSGAGFPALPLKIVLPNLEYTLIESIYKKTMFLRTVVNQLNLKQIHIVCERAENLNSQKEYGELFDFATARAVTSLKSLVELSLPFLKKNAILYAYKGGDISTEIKSAKDTFSQLTAKVIDIYSYQLPENQKDRKLILIQKL